MNRTLSKSIHATDELTPPTITLPQTDVVIHAQQIRNTIAQNLHHQQRSLSTHSYNKSHDTIDNNNAGNTIRRRTPPNTGTHNSPMEAQLTTETIISNNSNYDSDMHQLSIEQLESKFRTDIENGLDANFADSLLQLYGKNELTPQEKESDFIKWAKHVFMGIFNILLWVASIIQIGIFLVFPEHRDKLDLIVPVILMFVVLSAGTFEWYQEKKSEKIMSSFANFIPQSVNVIRNGIITKINAVNLVIGDIVMLTAGDKIPADVIVLDSSNDMNVDNASLTGEAEPQKRSNKCTHRNPMDTENICFFGTLLLKGKGKGLVYRTGDDTLLGQIARLAGSKSNVQSTFAKEVESFVGMISWIAILIGLSCMAYDILNGENLKATLYFGISIIIANIPEGLLPTVTLALSLSAKRMKRKNVLVRNLESVETLGCVNVICSDKTGTITMGKMSVSHIYTIGNDNIEKYKPRKLKEKIIANKQNEYFRLFRVGILCNNATVHKNDDDNNKSKYEINGYPTEVAILRASIPVISGLKNYESIKECYKNVFEIPFNSDNKWHLSIHETNNDLENEYLLQIKGAPEKILDLCGYYYNGSNEKVKLNEDVKNKIKDDIKKTAELGERVLCFAQSIFVDDNKNYDNCDFNGECFETANWFIDGKRGGEGALTFVGFMSLIDPPRKEVKHAIDMCHSAGIRVVMVTGDHQITAAAIAKQVGIIQDDNNDNTRRRRSSSSDSSAYNSGDLLINNVSSSSLAIDMGNDSSSSSSSKVITGTEIDEILDLIKDVNNNDNHKNMILYNNFWDDVISYNSLVFARTTPIHKMIIVKEFQKRNMIVAVTGDGVNDAPALNQANVGVAMGQNGTDVAREASDIILMDDNFSSIVNGIEEGRLITDNLKKSIAYTLCSKLPQLAPTIGKNIFGIPLAMTMMQVLLIDLGTDIWTGVAMAYEKKEDDIMHRKPRNLEKNPMVTWKMMVYSYLHIGILQMLGCFLAFQQIMYDSGNGVYFTDLFKISNKADWNTNWGNENLYCYKGDTINSFCTFKWNSALNLHHTITPIEQNTLLRRAQTSFYVALILMQICAAICSQTRVASVLKHGLTNKWLNICLVMELLFGVAVVYLPFFQELFETKPLEPICWFAVTPFVIILFAVEEFRKWYGRTGGYKNKHKNKTWLQQLIIW